MDRAIAFPTLAPRRRGALATVFAVLALRRSRRRLLVLDARLLDDVGLTREDASREAARRAWDPPAHWLR